MDVLRHPGHLFDDIFIQSIGIIQAPDILPDGRADMCDSCPTSPSMKASSLIRAVWMNTGCLAGLFQCGKRKEGKGRSMP